MVGLFYMKKVMYRKFAQWVPVPTQGIPCKTRSAGPVFRECDSSDSKEEYK